MIAETTEPAAEATNGHARRDGADDGPAGAAAAPAMPSETSEAPPRNGRMAGLVGAGRIDAGRSPTAPDGSLDGEPSVAGGGPVAREPPEARAADTMAEAPAGAGGGRRSAADHAEIELKLLVAPELLAGLDQAPPIVSHARNNGTVRHLKAVYFDTPGRALYRAGFTLRVRQSGKRFLQTVKTLAEESGELFRRGEWESPVAAMAPELPALLPLVGTDLHEVLGHEPLRPVFTTQVRRHLRLLELPAGLVEVAFDHGVITAGDRTAEISEIELELKRGDRAALYDIALPLGDLAAVRPSTLSKAQRGFALAFDLPPEVHKAGRPALAPDMSVDDAFAAILQSALAQLFANEPAAADGRDPEGVHQMRVALRRLRSALALLRRLAPSPAIESFRADAQWLASSLGEARNWDVFLTETVAETVEGCGTIDGFDALRAVAERHRAAGYAAARRALADRRAWRLALALGAWIEARGWRGDVTSGDLAVLAGPVVTVAERALARQHRKVLRRGRHFKQLTPEARHELRLAVKRLRYTVDFFLSVFGDRRPVRRYAHALATFQAELGCYNDMATTRQLIGQFAVDAMPGDARQALGAVAGWQARAVVGAEADLRAAWRAFRHAPPPWPAHAGHDAG